MDINRDLLARVLEYPLVQYITLTRRDLLRAEAGMPLKLRGKIHIQLFTSEQSLENVYFPAATDKNKVLPAVDFNRKFAILALNYDVKDLKYRTTKITAIGQPMVGLYYLFVVDRHLFYRRAVYFQCYDMSGKEIPMPTAIYDVPLTAKRLRFDR